MELDEVLSRFTVKSRNGDKAQAVCPCHDDKGEKDCQTMQKYGYSSFTAGASGDWHSGLAELVRGAELIILQDNDSSGKRLSEQIKNDVKDIAKSVRIIVPTPNIEKGDVSDFFATNGKKEFEALTKQETVKEESTRIAEQDNKSREEQVQEVTDLLMELNPKDNYSMSDEGEGSLFSDVFMKKHRYYNTWKSYGYFDGISWMFRR